MLSSRMSKVLAKLGEPCTVSYQTGDSIDPDTGIFTAGTVISMEGFCAQEQYSASEVDGSNVLRGDLKLVVSKLLDRPEVGSVVNVDSKNYTAINVEPVRFKGADVVYMIQGRV
jgi:hypothetical protein